LPEVSGVLLCERRNSFPCVEKLDDFSLSLLAGFFVTASLAPLVPEVRRSGSHLHFDYVRNSLAREQMLRRGPNDCFVCFVDVSSFFLSGFAEGLRWQVSGTRLKQAACLRASSFVLSFLLLFPNVFRAYDVTDFRTLFSLQASRSLWGSVVPFPSENPFVLPGAGYFVQSLCIPLASAVEMHFFFFFFSPPYPVLPSSCELLPLIPGVSLDSDFYSLRSDSSSFGATESLPSFL